MSSITHDPDGKQAAFVGVDTHKDSHHVAVIDTDGRVLADRRFGTGSSDLTALLAWVGQWSIGRVGVEQSGTYGAELTRCLSRVGYLVVEVNQPDLVTRATVGKSDPIDAVAAAQAVRTGRARVVPKDRSGVVEAARVLLTTRELAVKTRSETLNQFDGMRIAAPAIVRERLGGSIRSGVGQALRMRPDPSRLEDPVQAVKYALRCIAIRIRDLDQQIVDLEAGLSKVLTPILPRLLARPQVGIITAAQLLIAYGQDPDRIPTDAKFARMAGIAPIPASSGKTNRMRLHRGGNRQINKVVHMVCLGRLRNYEPAISYLQRRTTEGLSKTDAIRAMKRLVSRELYGALRADLKTLKTSLDKL